MQLEREDETMVTITDIQGETVVVDGNHSAGRHRADFFLHCRSGASGDCR